MLPHASYQDLKSSEGYRHIPFNTFFNCPASTNENIDRIVVTNTKEQVISWDPVTPTFLPKNPDIIEPSKGNVIIVRYII